MAIPIIPLGGRRPSESSTSSIGVAQDYMLPSLQGTTSAGLSHFLQEKDQRIKSLEQSLEDREKEGANHQEELTELRRCVCVCVCVCERERERLITDRNVIQSSVHSHSLSIPYSPAKTVCQQHGVVETLLAISLVYYN